jgi:hypothetical protein
MVDLHARLAELLDQLLILLCALPAGYARSSATAVSLNADVRMAVRAVVAGLESVVVVGRHPRSLGRRFFTTKVQTLSLVTTTPDSRSPSTGIR